MGNDNLPGVFPPTISDVWQAFVEPRCLGMSWTIITGNLALHPYIVPRMPLVSFRRVVGGSVLASHHAHGSLGHDAYFNL